MTALDSQATQRNFLNTNNFKLLMHRAPNLELFIQKINIPGVTVDVPIEPTPFVDIPFAGVNLRYEPFSITFRVAEDLGDYYEMWAWMHASATAGGELGVSDYAQLKFRPQIPDGRGIKSDIVLMILDSAKVPKFEVTFHDSFPTSISEITFSSTESEPEYPVCTTVFHYTSFEIVPVGGIPAPVA